MTNLRERVVEAGVAEFESLMESDAEGAEWNTEEYVMHILDAMLDCLEENADEWDLELADWLLSALRESP